MLCKLLQKIMKKSLLHSLFAAALLLLVQACNPETSFTTNSQEHISDLTLLAENESSLPTDSNLVATLSGDSLFIHALPNSWLSPRFNLHECSDYFKEFDTRHDSSASTLKNLVNLDLSPSQKSAINLALDSFADQTEEIISAEFSEVHNLNLKSRADIAKYTNQLLAQQISYATFQQKIAAINTDYRAKIQDLHYNNKQLLLCLSAYRNLLENVRTQTNDKQWLKFFQLEKQPLPRH